MTIGTQVIGEFFFPLNIILEVMSWFCWLGGQYIAPFFVPLINPMSWSALLLCCFLPLALVPENWFNTDSKTKTKTTLAAFESSVMIGYPISIILACILMNFACQVRQSITDNTGGLV